MQIQHESQLIEPTLLGATDLIANYSQTLDEYTLNQAGLNSIDYVACNPAQGGTLLGVYSRGSNQITLIDTRNSATRRDKFSLKACDKRFSRKSFVAKGIDFSPDGTKLAIGQSDCIIYIYKIGQLLHHNDSAITTNDNQAAFSKPVISGKFVCSNPVTCLIWTEAGIIFGTRDGKVKLISSSESKQSAPILSGNEQQLNQSQQQPIQQTQTKVINLYNSPKGSMPITLASKLPVIGVGFADGSLQVLTISSLSDNDKIDGITSIRRNSSNQASILPAQTLHLDHGYPPSQMAFIQTNQLYCVGSDGRLVFYTIDLEQGKSVTQTIEFKESIIWADYSMTNDIIAFATKNRLSFAILNAETNKWQLQTSSIEFLPPLSMPFTLTCIKWIKDGAQLVVGTQFGSLELFKCNWSKQSLNDQLDICHIAKNRVRITDKERNLLATYKTSHDIKRVNLFDEGQNVLIWTTGSLLMARLGVFQSEINWRRNMGASSKFYFHPTGYVIILLTSTWELFIVKLGLDSIYFNTKIDSQMLNKNTLSLSCFPSRFDSASSGSLNYHQRGITKSTLNNNKGISDSSNSDNFLQTNSAYDNDKLGSSSDQLALTSKSRAKRIIVPVERFAYTTNFAQCLNLIDLGTNTKRIIAKESELKFLWLELSCTGKYLAWRNSKNRLTLLQIPNYKDRNDDKITNEIKLDQVTYSKWIPETDILVAQSLHKIYIWYKIELLHNPKVIDSRSYNILKRAPIFDLSFSTSNQIMDNPANSAKAYPDISRLVIGDFCITLSNGCSIPLDNLFINFHKEIINLRLEQASRLLEKEQTSTRKRVSLWNELGWMAIKEEDLDTAIRAFMEVNYTSMVDYLRECTRVGLDEMRWRLAKLNGDWDSFERLQDPETIVSTYKRLNKWSKCIEYLARTQQFRQKDLAELELRQWLISRGRILEAAKIQAKQTGDLEGAIELLVDKERYQEAAKLLLEEYKQSTTRFQTAKSSTILTRLRDQLIAMSSYELAANICKNILDNSDEALELFLRGELYEEALVIANQDMEKANIIRRQFAVKLLNTFKQNQISRRQAIQSIQLYLESGALIEALEAAIALGEGKRALEMLEKNIEQLEEAEQLPLYCDRVAQSLLSENLKLDAIRAYQLGKQHSKVVALSIEEKKFDEAFRVSLKFIHNDDKAAAKEEFNRLAEKMVAQENDFDSAEKIYLLIGEIDCAIEMHRSNGQYERMLEIVQQYQPESMERNLLLLAKEMEQGGKFQEAEKYLLMAGPDEWINVVRMYRLANRFDGAYRVARENCQSTKDPLLVQLAYFWAKSELSSSSSMKRAKELLSKLDCLHEVIEFSCDNNNFSFATELSEQNSTERREIVKKHAHYLEQKQDLPGAEEVLVKNNQLDDAVRMYLDNDLHLDAIRVIEEAQQSVNGNHSSSNNQEEQQQPSQLVELLNRTLIEAADQISKRQLERNDGGTGARMGFIARGAAKSSAQVEANNADDKQLALAQQMYLRAQRPDLAIEMYKKRGLWQEAIQLAQRFAPHLLESVEKDLDAQVSLDLKPIFNGSPNTSSLRASSKPSAMTSRESSSRSSSLATSVATLNGIGEQETIQQLPPDATDQYLISRADQLIRRGHDPKRTRQALGNLLSNLADGDPLNEASCLILSEKLAHFEQYKFFDWDIVQKVHSIADQLFQVSCPLLINGTTIEHILVWQRVRNMMAKMIIVDSSINDNDDDDDQTTTILLQKTERKLLASHFALLHKCLADKVSAATTNKGQSASNMVLGPTAANRLILRLKTASGEQQLAPLVGLLSKLSMSLLRYSDLLDGRACFLSAGFWTLVAGQMSFARFAWSRLIELIDDIDSSSSSNRLGRQLMQADCPPLAFSGGQSSVSVKYQSLGEIRSWLIESLLANQVSLELTPLDHDGQLESSLRGSKYRPCLVTGYPVFPQSSNRLVLGQTGGSPSSFSWEVHQTDWRSLKMLASESESESSSSSSVAKKSQKQQSKLNDCVKFIEQLAGLNK